MDITLINPPEKLRVWAGIPKAQAHGVYCFPPLGLMYIQAAVEKRSGYKAEICDPVVDDLDYPDLSRLDDEQFCSAEISVVQDILQELSELGRAREQDENFTAMHEDKKDCYKGGSEKAGFNRGGAGKTSLSTAALLGSKGNPIQLS